MSQLGMLNNLPAGSGLEWLEGSGDLTDLGGPLDKTAADLGQAAVMTAIERQAELRPNKVAVNDGDVSLTYAELVDRVHGLRSRIIQAAPTGGVVATLLHNGTGAIVAMIAAVTSGRTLVPIDAGHPIERQAALFAESGASAVVLAKGVAVETSFIGPSIIRLEFDVAEPWSGERSPAVVTPLTFPSVVMFTSGSTGRPKGIAYGVGDGEQIRRYVKKFRLNETDVFISLASLSQTGAADIIGLTVGATVRIVDARRRGIFEVLRVMGDEGVTFLSFVPSVLRGLLSMPKVAEALRHLRVLDLHGEPILATDVAMLRAKLPANCCISITFGSTEASGVFSWFVRDEAIEGAVAPIGYIVDRKRVALIDENGAPVSPGEVGELVVRGRMSLGSWTGGRLTGARFLQDPEDPDSRIYGMGDLVRQRADGLFEYVGRRDRQIKVRGLWADLGEIETALRGSDGVADAVVVVRSGTSEADSIVAFVTMLEPSSQPDKAQMRRTVVSATAEHMAPADIRVISAIPRLANYKPDLQRLNALLERPNS